MEFRETGRRIGRALPTLAVIGAVALLGACKPSNMRMPWQPPGGGVPGGDAAMPLNAMPISSVAGSWTTFNDPSESAFTVAAPQGWQTKGGVLRKSEYEAKTWFTATSQDGATSVFMGDPSIPLFTLPDQQHQAGSTVNTAGGSSQVMDYETGAQFAADYIQRSFAAQCTGLQPLGTQPEPDLAQKAQAEGERRAAAVGSRVPASATSWDGGSARFSCQTNAGPSVVTVFAVTAVSHFGPGGLWNAIDVFGYRTPAGKANEADAMTRAMHASMQRNPSWEAKMTDATRTVLARQNAQGDQQMAALQHQEASDSAMLKARGDAFSAAQQQRQNTYMASQNAQRDARNGAFAAHEYNRQTGSENFVRHIYNRHCAEWYDAAHTRCKYEVDN